MGIVKSMLGGLVGGAVGAIVANVIQSAAGVSSPWFLLVTGLGTGIGVRAAAGANRNFVTGVVGAVMTVVVLLGSSVATSLAEVGASPKQVEIAEIEFAEDPGSDSADVDATADDPAAESAEEPTADGESADDAESSDTDSEDATEPGEDPDAVESLDEEAARAATAAASAASAGITADGPITDEAALEQLERQSGWSVMDFLFNGVSALLAFALSSGSGSTGSRSEPASESQS